MARVLNWRNGWGFKTPLGFRILMDGASSTIGASFVQFWPKLLPFWCKSAVAGASPLLVQAAAAVWCKSGAPTGEQQLWWKQGKFGASSVRLGAPRALLGSKTHTGETCSATLSLSRPLSRDLLSPSSSTISSAFYFFTISFSTLSPKIFSYEMAFSLHIFFN